MASVLQGCGAPETVAYAPVIAGEPMVGAAEGTLELPVGTPLSGFSVRCQCLGGISKQDDRDSAYTTTFVESTGVHIRPTTKVIWIENGDDHMVLIKNDIIYSFDGLVDTVSRRLQEETGESLLGKVIHTTNHSHSSYGTFSDAVAFYLGSDKFNRENFERTVHQLVEVALEAYDSRQPAAIGIGWAEDWDPNDLVYRDRRSENDELAVWANREPGMDKDPTLAVLRMDTLDGAPIAIGIGFGMHPYALDERNSLITADASFLVERTVAEAFDDPIVVMHVQTGGGDASIAGTDDDYAKMETVGEYARDAILDLWEATPTSSEPMTMETHSRHIPLGTNDIRVTRGGEVDWYYTPYDPDYKPDDLIWDENGELLSPIDEFTTEYGAVFCGTGDIDLPGAGLNSFVPPYSTCLEVELLSWLIQGFFYLDDSDVILPFRDTTTTGTTASVWGNVATRYPDGTVDTAPLLLGFVPGEPTAMYTEQWRVRANKELGYEMPLLVGYAQDHEGYLLIPEDWLAGGYEADIVVWGPLQGEYIMESILDIAGDILSTDVHEPRDPHTMMPFYPERPLPTVQPDTTPNAGTRVNEVPPYLWLPDGFTANPTPSPEIQRVQDSVQLLWLGGDPGVDNPDIRLQVEREAGWEDVTTRSGRPITEDGHDIIIAHTPDPLYPAEAVQTHYWWAVWQAVGHIHDRTGLPEGTYRLHVTGRRYVGGDETWPWTTESYELETEPFQILPATLDIAVADGGIDIWLQAPNDGYRMVDIAGSSVGENPVRGTLVLEIETADTTATTTFEATEPIGGRTHIALEWEQDTTRITVFDTFGNHGTLMLSPESP